MGAQTSPYKVFWNWVFDGKKNSPIPMPEVLLKYNSPINETFLLKSFITCGKLNFYLDKHLNNIGIRYIEKEDLFEFFKQAIKDFRVKRKDIHYSPWKQQDVLAEKIKKKFPLLKGYDISLYLKLLEKSGHKDAVYSSFGVDKPKKQKVKKQKKKSGPISLKEMLKNFNTIPYTKKI